VRNLSNVGAIAAGLTVLLATAGLVVAWVNVGHFTKPWPPKGVNISNYDGTMLVLTMLMTAATVEWGIWAARRDQRTQASTALFLSCGLGLAFLNLLWFFGKGLAFGPGKTPFAAVLFSMLALIGVATVAGVGALLAVAARVVGQQVRGSDIEMARAAGWFWQFVVVSWVVIYATVWLFS
jgi:heme/copper-type cytochrome/quinol oxidase subunit 3